MINVVLKKDVSDYSQYLSLLDSAGFTYTRSGKNGRILVIETEQKANDFIYKDHEFVNSCTDPVKFKLSENLVTTDYTNIFTRYYKTGDPLPPVSWGPFQLIRKRSFSRVGSIPQPTFRTGKFGCVRSGIGVDIYMVDTGFRTTHNDFGGRAQHVDGQPDRVLESSGHGTATTGCAAGNLNGIAKNAQIYCQEIAAILTSDDSVLLSFFDPPYQHYLSRAGTNRPAVVNCSIGMTPDQISAPVHALFDDMIDDGLVICVSSGNERLNITDISNYAPANIDEDIIVVGSHDLYDRPMYTNWQKGSNYGLTTDLYAPGTFVSTSHVSADDAWTVVSGTSFSSPYVAGIVACMLEGYQRLTSRTQVQAVQAKLIANSQQRLQVGTWFQPDASHQTLLNRCAYLDPHIAIEPIDGLVPV